jgi:hypothetical protein
VRLGASGCLLAECGSLDLARNDQRRRRVVIDGALQNEDGVNEVVSISVFEREGATTAVEPTAGYDRRAGRGFQLRTTDLIPKRPKAVFLFATAVATVVILLNLLHLAFSNWPIAVSSKFSLGQTGSITAWFSTVFLMLACLACLQIYSLRQHRSDDYRGTYRIWLLFAGALLLSSMNCIVNFNEMLGDGSHMSSPSPLLFWSLWATKALVVSGLFIRGFVELRLSRGSLALAAISSVAYVSSLVLQIPEVTQSTGTSYALVLGNTQFLGHAFLLVALVVYARNVFLISNGLMAVRTVKAKTKTKPSKKKSTVADETEESKAQKAKPKKSPKVAASVEDDNVEPAAPRVKETEPPKKVEIKSTADKLTLASKPNESGPKRTFTSPLASKMKPTQAPAKAVENEDEDVQDDQEPEGTRRLSKSERRRLRKEQSSSRRAA